MQSQLLVTVIVPVWNDVDRILLCVEALKAQTLKNNEYEIFVVDNGSTDGTYEKLLSQTGITLLQESNPGSYSARNKGLKEARGKYVAFTDSDCIPDEKWLENLISCAINKPSMGIIAGDIRFFKENTLVEASALAYEELFSMDQETYAKLGLCITANWLSDREVIINNSGFDTSLKSGGDHEMSQRLTEQGLRVYFCQDAVVMHPARNKKEILKKRKRVIGGAWDKSASKVKAIRLIINSLKLYIKRSIKIFVSSDFSLQKRFSVYGIITLIFITSVKEIARLSLGQKSSRS